LTPAQGRPQSRTSVPVRTRAPPARFHSTTLESAMSNFWDMVWLMISTFFFVAYLIIMFQIVVDLFRDHELGGGSKVLWVIGLIFIPVLTAIIYIIARGKGMAARQQASLQKAKAETETYIKEVAGKSPAQHIADAKALLDAGTITQAEFDKLKAKALS
jgi:ABC-type multidrug transport system fused ATPase/permease subunit